MPDVGAPSLAQPGAVAASGVDSAVAGHYGDPFGEQRRLAAGDAVVDLSHLDVLSIAGIDAALFVNNLLSQKLDQLGAGESTEALLLDAAGHIEGAFAVIRTADGFLMITDPGEGPRLVDWFDSMRFMLRIEVSLMSDAWAAIGFRADGAAAASLALATSWTWRDPWPSVAEGGVAYSQIDTDPWAFRLGLVPRGELESALRSIREQGVALAGLNALEALRIAAGRPRFATERDERSLPHEYGWLRTAVHVAKGCYRGQETVAKIHNLGHPPRRLVLLNLDGADADYAAPGDEVFVEGNASAVGRVTASANHFEWGPIALAIVKRSTPETAELSVLAEGARVRGTQTVLVPGDAGAVAADAVRSLRTARRSS